ncbi:MAG: hypothetical protein Q7T82_10280 [Armatimonadota bacterium]|nr:hypothetical protein [Armatimonadota bacterium]
MDFILYLGKWLASPRHGLALWLLIAGGLALGVAIFLLLRATPGRYRKLIVMAVTFLAGLFYIAEFFWSGTIFGVENFLSPAVQPLGDVIMVVGSFTLLLGVVNLVAIHAKAIRAVRPGWHNSLAFFIAMVAIMAAGLIPYLQEQSGQKGSQSWTAVYQILFNGMLAPLGATMFSLVAFYIVSASYRAFRIRSGEATLMMLAAFLVMLGMVPIGIYLTHWLPETGALSNLRLERITQWILTGPNAAAQRAIAFGIAVGGLAMALRIWLSLEKGSFFDKQ